MNNKIYWYGMRLRPFGLGCQPSKGLIETEQSREYHDEIGYNRKLTDEEVFNYDLDFIYAIDLETGDFIDE